MELSPNDLRELLCQNRDGATRSGSCDTYRREIVVADRGWVVVGMVRKTEDGDLIVDGCSCIRVWGTTRGLGQLALDGPTKDTKLDALGDGVVVPARSQVLRIPCVGGAKW